MILTDYEAKSSQVSLLEKVNLLKMLKKIVLAFSMKTSGMEVLKKFMRGLNKLPELGTFSLSLGFLDGEMSSLNKLKGELEDLVQNCPVNIDIQSH